MVEGLPIPPRGAEQRRQPVGKEPRRQRIGVWQWAKTTLWRQKDGSFFPIKRRDGERILIVLYSSETDAKWQTSVSIWRLRCGNWQLLSRFRFSAAADSHLLTPRESSANDKPTQRHLGNKKINCVSFLYCARFALTLNNLGGTSAIQK